VKKSLGVLDRTLRALNDPLRRRILQELVDEPCSASMLARRFHLDLGVVSYHLNQVLARQCKVVELVDTVQRRGSVEKYYLLRLDAPSGLPSTGEPGSREEMLWTLALGHGLLETARATKGKR
jgi:DNA-binding transcriptional ArsR family regulator